MDQRASGVLLHISSLPGPFSVGGFGPEARAFGQSLSEAGFRYWQVLPFTIPGEGNSPYLSRSAFAGNPLFIDLRELIQRGWLTEASLSEAKTDILKTVDYEYAERTHRKVLRIAFSSLSEKDKNDFRRFARHRSWLSDYAAFSVALDLYEGITWREWPDLDLRSHNEEFINEFILDHQDDYDYYCFEQFLFNEQWQALKRDLNDMGILIIGDIPIYVSENSADVWGHRSLFQIDEDFKLKAVAGVPPDYFSSEGQLWGNPLYDWGAHESEDFKWWTERLSWQFELYDLIRIDHFRAFSSYWSVPPDQKTAVMGHWVNGPGLKFFQRMRKKFDRFPIFAEDLGEETQDLHQFLEDVGFPGMRVVQFAFDAELDNKHRPHNYPSDCVVYSGTHDNDTLAGWYDKLSDHSKKLLRDYSLPGNVAAEFQNPEKLAENVTEALLAILWRCHANLLVVPVQDLLRMGSERRMNIPGTPSGNWKVRFSQTELASLDIEKLSLWNACFARVGRSSL